MDRVEQMQNLANDYMEDGPAETFPAKAKDYNNLFKKGKLNFIKLYERFNQNTVIDASGSISDDNVIHEIVSKCQEKLSFGVKKYGSSSFQTSLENCFLSPFFEHAMDEMIDLINYLNHIIFVGQMTDMDEEVIVVVKKIINDTMLGYEFVKDMQEEYTDEIKSYLQ